MKELTYACDLETNTHENNVRVWASASYCLNNMKLSQISNDLEGMMTFFQNHSKSHVAYFHNLKFDGQFILYWLYHNGYDRVDNVSDLKDKTFCTLIVEMGAFYKIEICHHTTTKVTKHRSGKTSSKTTKCITTLKDSLKKIAVPISAMPKMFGFDDIERKLEIDYHMIREEGHEMTEEERDYLIADVRILALSLNELFKQGLTKLTSSSDALNAFKNTLVCEGDERYKDQEYRKLFPLLDREQDSYIRKSYKGGFTYLNPKCANIRYKEGLTYDVKSLYPSVMYNDMLPYGVPLPVNGECVIKEGSIYKLFIQRMQCSFKLKQNHIPTIQIKGSFRFLETEYLTDSDGLVTLTLTNVDMELMFKHYDVDDITYIDGMMFKGSSNMFKDYIDYWGEKKINANDPGERQSAKLMLNSLYGKFASSTDSVVKVPYINEDDKVRFKVLQGWVDDRDNVSWHPMGEKQKDLELHYRDSEYTALASFVTAYSRRVTINACQENYDRFIYTDTDSVHLIGYEEPKNMDIHESRLGSWKLECKFTDSLFLRAKTYIEVYDGHMDVKCAGMPKSCKELVTFENFKSGSVFPGKLVPKVVPGGVYLESTNFTIK